MDPLTLFHKRMQCYSEKTPLDTIRKYISKNPKLTMEMVFQDKYGDLNGRHWYFDNLCFSIPCKVLLENGFTPDKADNFTGVLKQPSLETLIKYKFNWNWSLLSRNKNFTIEEIIAHPELDWYANQVAYNPNLKLQHLLDYPHFFPDHPHVMYQLSRTASFEDITNHPTLMWATHALSSPNIKKKEHIKHLIENQFKNYSDSYSLKVYACSNPNLSFEDIIDVLGIEEVLDYAAFNPNTTFDHFKRYPIRFWKNVHEFADRAPLEFIMEHPEYNWDWFKVAYCNIHITYENYHTIVPHVSAFIEKRFHYKPGLYHNLHMFYHNKHLSDFDKKRFYEDILALVHEKFPNNKDEVYPPTFLHPLSFVLQCPQFLEPTFQEIKEYFAKKRIVRILVECITNPSYLQCLKRLIREHNNLV
jgi:hypothetical protein